MYAPSAQYGSRLRYVRIARVRARAYEHLAHFFLGKLRERPNVVGLVRTGGERLKLQLHTPAFRRVYLAVCDGAPSPAAGVIDAPIGRAPGSLVERRVDPAGQRAVTAYRTLKAADGRALVELELDTGRTHQIRVHMAHLGCPLTGDFLYGREDKALISRPALHSARLSLRHPVTGAAMEWTSPLPPDMAALLA